MIHRIAPAATVKSVAVCEEDLGPEGAQVIHQFCGIVRADICQIARLPEMNLDCSELSVKIHRLDSGCLDKAYHLGH